MEKKSLTQKQLFIGGLLALYENGATCYQIMIDHKEALNKQGIGTERPNATNATLASIVGKGYATKDNLGGINPNNKKQCTLYKANQELIDLLKESNK